MLNRNKIIVGMFVVLVVILVVLLQLVYVEENINEVLVYEVKDNNGIIWYYCDIEEDEIIGIIGIDDVKSYMEILDIFDGKKVLVVYGIVKNLYDINKLKIVIKVKLVDLVFYVDLFVFEGCINLIDIEMLVDVDYIGDEKYVF